MAAANANRLRMVEASRPAPSQISSEGGFAPALAHSRLRWDRSVGQLGCHNPADCSQLFQKSVDPFSGRVYTFYGNNQEQRTMTSQRYTASKSPTRDGTGWIISFRHPLRKDPRGKQGRKVRRGLGTSDETRAQALVDEMNILLGDAAWQTIAKRPDAERRFDPVIVRAFYDDIENAPSNTSEIRNEALPLPSAAEGYAKVLMVGTTGAGKTSLLRHLMGSHPDRDRFPSTSASRTTVSDIEVITGASAPYRAVVTFFNEWTVHTNVYECVADACAGLWDDLSDDKLAERLLTHRDLRFRLGYVVGSWRQTPRSAAKANSDWDYEPDAPQAAAATDEFDGVLPAAADIERMQDVLKSWLTRIRTLSSEAKLRLEAELNVEFRQLAGPDKEAAQDLFEDLVQTVPDFDDLVGDIMDEIRLRFESVASEVRTHASGWPLAWEYSSGDRDAFVRAVRRFSSNHAPAFGTLLTPLVDGIRIQRTVFTHVYRASSASRSSRRRGAWSCRRSRRRRRLPRGTQVQ